MLSTTRSRIWLFCVLVLILGASSCSSVSAPSLSGIDKVAHFGIFGLLATHLHLSGLTSRRLWLTILLCSVFGALDEFHQAFTPGRSVDALDWVADTLGAALASFLLSKWGHYRNVLLFRLF